MFQRRQEGTKQGDAGEETEERGISEEGHTMLRIESFWKPNFCARSRKMSSISSVDMGIWRSADHAGYGSLEPGMSENGLLGPMLVLMLMCESTDAL